MSTNILDLPTGPPNQTPPNVVLETSPHQQQAAQQALEDTIPPALPQQPPPAIQYAPPNVNNRGGNMNANNGPDVNTMNKVIADLQQASVSGATQLASRDMSMSAQQQQHVQDEHVKPNFVPQEQNDYISADHEYNEMKNMNKKRENKNDSLDAIYDEIQTPILIMLLFFLFQLPFFNKFINRSMPFLYSIDGNPNVGCYITKSLIFALLYYVLFKVMKHFSEY